MKRKTKNKKPPYVESYLKMGKLAMKGFLEGIKNKN